MMYYQVKQSTLAAVDTLIARYPVLKECRSDLVLAVKEICLCYHSGGRVLTCGNGGSASDAEHIFGELMKGFLMPRRLTQEMREKLEAVSPEHADYIADNLQMALPAVSLVNETALTTAFSNDQAPDLVFAQQVLGLGRQGDLLIGISTSGNSSNVVYAVETAHAIGVRTLVLTGRSGGRLKGIADVSVCVPDDETYRIQELHLPVYHMLCIAAENECFGS